MPLIALLVVLILVGVLMWAVNTLGAPYMWPPILKIFNAVAVVAVVVYVLFWFLGFFGVSLGNVTDFGLYRHR